MALLHQDTVLAVVVLEVVAGLSASVWCSLGAKLDSVDANVRVLVIDLAFAGSNGDKLAVFASVVSGIEAGDTTWLVNYTAEDWAKEIVVSPIAGVGFWVVGLRTAVKNAALLNFLWDWRGSCNCGEGSENEGDELHFEGKAKVGGWSKKIASVD